MKKLLLAGLIILSTHSFADSLNVRVGIPIHDGVVTVAFRDDDHRYDKRYRNFNYDRYGYYDNYGYYFGYFDRVGYFFNNIFFLYDSNYTYYDRLHRRGNFRPNHPHFRKYRYSKVNNWNQDHRYRNDNERIYGHYYDKNPRQIIQRHDNRKEDYRTKKDRYDDVKSKDRQRDKDRIYRPDERYQR